MSIEQIVSRIREVKSESADITNQIDHYSQLKEKAVRQIDAVSELQHEVRAVQSALDEIQAASFIAGSSVDVSDQTASLDRAKRRYEKAVKDAAAARAATPRIDDALADLRSEANELANELGTLERQYWDALIKKEEVEYVACVERLCSLTVKHLALDRYRIRTAANENGVPKVGRRIVESLRRGPRLVLPNLRGGAVDLSFGFLTEESVDEQRRKLESEFRMQIAGIQ